MTELTLGWAMVGKRPGSRDEQSVMAASARPFTSSQLHKLVTQSAPGNLPSTSENGAAALPWVWLANARLHDVAYLCIAVSKWSGTADAFQRAIAHTRYFFLPLEEFLTTSMRLTDLYATVADVHPPWEDQGSPFSHEQITVSCRRGDESWTSPLTLEAAAVAAAKVVEQPVALVGGRSLGLGARLAALDSICELLPGGALRWLTTAGWATGSHPIRLFFTDQARGTDLTLPLRGTLPEPSGAAADYRDTLLRLHKQYDHDAVVKHMRNLVKVQDKDFGSIQSSLNELDLVTTLDEQARAGTLDLALARKLQTNGPYLLTNSQKSLILGTYLAKATAHDIREGHALLVTQWAETLGQHLTNAVDVGLNTRRWNADDLTALADVAESVHAPQHFLSGLRPRSTKRSTTEFKVVWTVVADLAARPQWHASLAGFVAAQPDLSLHAAELVRSRIRPPDPFYFALDDAGRHTKWAQIRRLYWPEEGIPPASPTDVAVVMEIDRDAIPRLLRNPEVPADSVLAAVLPYLDQNRYLLNKHEWEEALRGLHGLNVVHEAWLDFLLYRAAKAPVHVLPYRQDYVEALAARITMAGISLADRSLIVERAVKALPANWMSDQETFVSIMDALWQLGTAPDGAEQRVPPVLVDQIKRELNKRPNLLDDERLSWWSKYFHQFRVGQEPPAASSFAQLTENTPVETVADLIVSMVTATKRPPKATNVVTDLRTSWWKPRPEEWAYLVIAVQFRLNRLNHKDSDKFCGQLIEELVKELNIHSLDPLTSAMAGYAQTMVSGVKAVENKHSESIDANKSEVLNVIKTANSLKLKPRFSKQAYRSTSDEPSEDQTTTHIPVQKQDFQYTDQDQTHGW